MLSGKLSWHARNGRALAASAAAVALVAVALAVVALAVVALGPVSASASAGAQRILARQPLQRVSYLGYSFQVPRGWPVIRLSASRHTCVRFDRHAVYLGAPDPDQACPSWLVGTTEAMLIQPASGPAALTSVEDPVARQITVSAPGITVSATFGADPTRIYQILASASLPAPVIQVPNPAAPARAGSRHAVARPRALRAGQRAGALRAGQRAGVAQATAVPATGRGADLPAMTPAVANFRGLGFDSCTAPSGAYMRAWLRHSPYRAVGIYIGGSDRACAQPNLTAGWLRDQAAAGWRFIPMYVGPQAAFDELHSPGQQGTSAANDAISQAERFGFGRGTPIYYDMEAYPPRKTGAALRFLSAWTARVHRLGYASGVYSSSRSGIIDLAREYSSGKYQMPDVIYDALWNGKGNVSDSVFRRGQWTGHRRLHQYSGNVRRTFGGDTIDIDEDYLDVRLPVPETTSQASPAIRQAGGSTTVFYAGPDQSLRMLRYSPRSGWERPVDLGGRMRGGPSAVDAGGGRIDVFYRGPRGGLWQVAYRPGAGWSRRRQLGMMGTLGGAPKAVSQSDGVIDVFWMGTDRHLWHCQFNPGRGWSGPRDLGGTLVSYPSPVTSSQGTVAVFWKGAGRRLWEVTRSIVGTWTAPARVRVGRMGGPPRAAPGAGGQVGVFWRGLGSSHLLAVFFRPGRGWAGPIDLGGVVSKPPLPISVTAGAARVLFKGRNGRLWQVVSVGRAGWRRPGRLYRRRVGSVPFAAVGSGGRLRIFWYGRSGALWTALLQRGNTWSSPQYLGRGGPG